MIDVKTPAGPIVDTNRPQVPNQPVRSHWPDVKTEPRAYVPDTAKPNPFEIPQTVRKD